MREVQTGSQTLIQKADAIEKARTWKTLAIAAITLLVTGVIAGVVLVTWLAYSRHEEEIEAQVTETTQKADLQMERGDYAAAQGLYLQALQLRPNSVSLHTSLAEAEYNNGSLSPALREVHEALRIDSHYGKAYQIWGHILLDQHHYYRGVAKWQEGARKAPHYSGNFRAMAVQFDQRGQIAAAIRAYQQGERADPSDTIILPRLERLQQEADRLSHDREKIHAQARLNPHSQPAMLLAAEELYEQGQDQQAVHALRQALKVYPKDAYLHYRLGTILKDQSSSGESLFQFQEAARLKPSFALAHFELANALKQRDQFQDALKEYITTIRLHPYGCDLSSEYNDCLADIQLVESRQKDARKTLAASPNDAAAHLDLGHAAWSLGNPDAAVTELQAAIRLDPKNAQAHDLLGLILLKKGQTDAAIREFNEGVRTAVDPSTRAAAYCNLGHALHDKGEEAQARAAWQKVLTMDDGDAADEARESLGITA